MTQLLQSHFVRQLPQGGSLWQYGQLFGCARASLHEKDFPRPGEAVTQVTKRGAVASRSDDGRSLHLDQPPQLQRVDALIRYLLRRKALIDGKGIEVQLRAVGAQ